MRTAAEQIVLRGAHLRSADVERWMHLRGWRTHEGFHHGAQVFVDEVWSGRFAARRIWQTPFAASMPPDPTDATRTLVVLVVAGRLLTGGTLELSAGDAAVAETSGSLALSSKEPSARIELWAPAQRRSTAADGDRSRARRAVSTAAAGIATSFINALLNSDLTPADAQFPYVRIALESLISAIVMPEEERMDEGTRGVAHLAVRAQTLVHDRASDPSFTVAQLARELAVSPRHLARRLAAEGTSASELIKRERLRRVSAMLGDIEWPGAARASEVAGAAGFSSIEAMRRAMS